MIYWQLFLSFLQIGALSFGGGYAAMPLIESQIVTSHSWLTMTEFANLVTIAEMTPGPIAVNAATFVGTKIGGVQVIFSPAGQSADKVIEKLAYDAGKRGVETMVVTSDAAIQDTVFGGGVDRMSADGFSHEMGEYYEDARLDDTPKVARKNTVAERIPADTLARLKALRDGR